MKDRYEVGARSGQILHVYEKPNVDRGLVNILDLSSAGIIVAAAETEQLAKHIVYLLNRYEHHG